jgi:hypothetical protein
MNRLEVQQAVRPLRRRLVEAAERVVAGGNDMPERAQFQHLVSICGQATCAEEIVNYLKYQAGRGVWKRDFTRAVIEAGQEMVSDVRQDEVRVEAWRLYALFMTRAHRYVAAGGGQG